MAKGAASGRQVKAPPRRRTYTTLSSRMEIDDGAARPQNKNNNHNNHRGNRRDERGRGRVGRGRGRGGSRGGANRNVNQATLDKDLENFMLKDQKTGSAMLDQDLDSYMQQG